MIRRRVRRDPPDYDRIADLEKEMLLGEHEHPYGYTASGLVDEVRVEFERALGHGSAMPPLTDRIAEAERVARLRWPHMFDLEVGAQAPPVPCR